MAAGTFLPLLLIECTTEPLQDCCHCGPKAFAVSSALIVGTPLFSNTPDLRQLDIMAVLEKARPGNDQWSDHTVGCRGFLVMLLWVMKNRSLKAQNKLKAMTLLQGMASQAFQVMGMNVPFMSMLTKKDGVLISRELRFSQQALCQGWGEFLRHCPGAAALWVSLGTRCWLNRCIASSLDNASFGDIWLFMAYLFCHQKLAKLGQNLWVCVARTCLPELIVITGQMLEALAKLKCEEPLKLLPILRRKTGNARKVADPVNRVLLLFKLRKEKQHRARIASTHDELGGATSRMVVFEAYVDCLLHMKLLENSFVGQNQLSVCWDPSTYGGKEICMAVVYAASMHKAAYLMCQQMTQTMLSELDQELLPLARKRKLTRLDSFKEIKALSSALGSIGLSLAHFQVPENLKLRPLLPTEYRVTGAYGQKFIIDEVTKVVRPEVPNGISLGDVPCLVSISDQGPAIIGSSNYLMYSEQALMFWAVFDPFHRCWNDLKSAMKKTMCSAWRVVLELTLVANINYGPFGSSTWHFKKRAKLEDFLARHTTGSDLWQKYQHLICQERKVPEPTTFEECQDLFDSMRHLESVHRKGPIIKLMRWFSFFESMLFYHGEFMATKLILEASQDQSGGASEQEIDEKPQPNQKDARKELADLKKRKGTWKLAPQLITERALAIKDLIMAVASPCWYLFAARAKDVTSPTHVLEYNISCSHQDFWKHELLETLQTSLYDRKHQDHLLPQFRGHDQVVLWHTDFMEKLLEERARSLAAFHLLPPGLYYHVLSPSGAIAGQAHDLAIKHWEILLEVEESAEAGVQIKPLDVMHWRLNPLIRCIFLSFQQDFERQLVASPLSAAKKLIRNFAQNLGDSRLIENMHQHGRDIFRASKANSSPASWAPLYFNSSFGTCKFWSSASTFSLLFLNCLPGSVPMPQKACILENNHSACPSWLM